MLFLFFLCLHFSYICRVQLLLCNLTLPYLTLPCLAWNALFIYKCDYDHDRIYTACFSQFLHSSIERRKCITFKCLAAYGFTGNFSMGKIIFIIAGLMIALLLADPSASQGMGGSKSLRSERLRLDGNSCIKWQSGQHHSTGRPQTPIVPEDRSGTPSARGLLLSWEGLSGIP